MRSPIRHLLFFLLLCFYGGRLQAALPWIVSGSTATATIDSEVYHYDLSVVLDQLSFTGALKYDNSTSDIHWIYDIYSDPQVSFGEWYFTASDFTWHFDIATQEWGLVDGEQKWGQVARNDWLNTTLVDEWQYDPVGTRWHHNLTARDNTTFVENWQYNQLDDAWLNTTLNTSWSFDYTTMKWSSNDNAETWRLDPVLEYLTRTTVGALANRWQPKAKNVWIEQVTGTIWYYLSPVDSQPSKWKNSATNETYSYNSESQSWHNDDTDQIAYFPPLTPALVVLQANWISWVGRDISTSLFILLPTSPTENYTWTDETNTLTFFGPTAFQMTLPILGITLGKGSHFGYTYDFELSNGEKWHITSSTTGAGAQYTNISTDIGSLADTVVHSAGTDRWWRQETFTPFVWQYAAETNEWCCASIGARFTFDYAALTWTDVGGTAVWKYYYNGSKWVWRNITSGEEWDYRTMSVGGVSQHVWYNNTTSYGWYPLGNEEVPLLMRSDLSQWSYNQSTHQWSCVSGGGGGQGGGGGLPSGAFTVFPMLPPTMAGYSGFLTHLAFTETTSTSSLNDAHGLNNRIESAADAVATLKENFDSITTTLQGLDQYRTLLPFFATAQRTRQIGSWLAAEYEALALAFNIDPFIQPTSDTSFHQWAPSRFFWKTAGKGAFKFQFANDTALCYIGLAPEPTTDGSATYTIIVGTQSVEITPEYSIDLFMITVKKGDVVLTSQQVVPAPDGLMAFWLQYDNGHITIGTGEPLAGIFVQNGINPVFDYTIVDGDIPSTIRYFSLNSDDTLSPIRGVPYDPAFFATQLQAVDIVNQCQDRLFITPLEEIWNSVKQSLTVLATTATTYREKAEQAQTMIDLVGGNSIVTNPLDAASSLVNSIYTQSSADYINYVSQSFGQTSSSLESYLLYSSLLQNLEDSFNPLLAADPSSLSNVEKQALIDDTRTAINNLIDIMSANIANLVFVTDSLCNMAGNENLAAFKNFFHEEIALLRDLSAVLALIDPLILERFTQQLSLYSLSSAQTQAEVARDEIRSAQERDSATQLLAERIVAGDATLFSALNAGAITFCVNSKFDEIRSTITSYLEANSYSDYHSFDVITDYQTAYSTLKTIFDAIKPTLDINGNRFFPAFSGTAIDKNETPSQAYISTTVTATDTTVVADQQKTTSVGNSDYLQNNYFTTSSDEHVTSLTRELITSSDDKTADYSRLYVKDSIVGLGNANMNTHSGNAISVLGGAEIAPDGSALIKLNSDIIVSGSRFLCPSPNFGYDEGTATRCIPAVPLTRRGQHAIIFQSDVPHSVIVTAGSTLDLTSFNNARVPGGQRIVFSGHTRLVFEPNTRLRLPYTSPADSQYQLILEFRDNAQLIFQGTENLDTERWDSPEGPDAIRTKILGVGTLQFNDQASASVLRSALVSVEADYTSNATNLVVELNGQSGWYVGDQNVSGGGFQVGNIADGGSNNLDLVTTHYPNNDTNPLFGDTDTPFIPHPTHIDFTLNLLGPNATFYIGRGGFVGFGVGTVNKSGLINGSLTNSSVDPMTDVDHFGCWEVHSLYNTGNISLNIQNGTFSHHQIAPGTSSNASLLAFGPQIPRALYLLSLNTARLNSIQGGGNVLFLRSGVTDPLPVPIWSSTAPLSGGSDDNGKYSLLAPVPLIATRRQQDAARPGIYVYGRAAVSQSGTAFQFTGPLDEFYLATTFQRLSLNNRFVISSLQNQRNSVTLIDNSGQVVTKAIQPRTVRTKSGRPVTATDLAAAGYLQSTTLSGNPQKFIKN